MVKEIKKLGSLLKISETVHVEKNENPGLLSPRPAIFENYHLRQ